jgi:ER degradation enhancer, mannosidase alpha-like 2
VVIGNNTEFVKGVKYIIEHANFDKDIPVSVFETNIRLVGGLISAHLLASDQSIMPEYRGELLPILKDLVDRLSFAFDTKTGIPYGTVNFKKGVPENEVQVTSVAGAGTFLLEFGLMSHLVGNSTYLQIAEKAAKEIFNRRSQIGLLGNHINIDNGQWTLKESGVGSGVDSYFEYLFKGYLVRTNENSLEVIWDRVIFQHVE